VIVHCLIFCSHSVVTTVRSQEKADKIKEAHPNYGKDKLDFSIVPDIAKEDAFEQAVNLNRLSRPSFIQHLHSI